ncbi:HU family DNA-binding protein, partial [Parabacteroides sp. OttesenSCG-928-J18]|nr:HU family DNA-binding protein [Parabacteroides sp. OttesenSCG-928-J18]
FSLYEIPLPGEQSETSRPQARVQSKGTIRLQNICDELRDLGVNSAQIKAVLDAVAKYMAKSLVDGYNFELEDIGTFSLSLHCSMADKASEGIVRVEANGVNFRPVKYLKEKVEEAELEQIEQSPVQTSLVKRKDQMISYLEKYGFVNLSRYALLNDCSRHQARKDIKGFVEEGVIVASGIRSHKVYVLA